MYNVKKIIKNLDDKNIKNIELVSKENKIFKLFFIDNTEKLIEVKTLDKIIDEHLKTLSDINEQIEFLMDFILERPTKINEYNKITFSYWYREV